MNHKKIYKLYLGSDGKFNQDVYPVIYETKSSIYYKRSRDDDLAKQPAWTVMEDLPVAVVMEKFAVSESKSCFVFYWNPVSVERLHSLEITFRQTALKGRLAEAEQRERNARYALTDARNRLERAYADIAKIKAGLERETPIWQAELERQARAIAELNQSGTPPESTFVYPGVDPFGQKEILKTYAYAKALILSGEIFQEDGLPVLYCNIEFPGDPRWFKVPAYSLIDLHTYLTEEKHEQE